MSDVTTTSNKSAPATGKTPSVPNPKNTLNIKGQADKPPERSLAELGLSPILTNTNTVRIFSKVTAGELDITEVLAAVASMAKSDGTRLFRPPI